MKVIPQFLETADSLKPCFYRTYVAPKQLVLAVRDDNAYQGWRMQPVGSVADLGRISFGKGDNVTLDFGDHYVGYLSLSVMTAGGPSDAPLRLKFIFGEVPSDMGRNFATYKGDLSISWLQEEVITADVLPSRIRLPRRYSFRYLRLEVVDTSPYYKVSFSDICVTAVTTGDISRVAALPAGLTREIVQLDRVGVKTLQECMQAVFEDGPKRDRRLWLGDLRLQAQANYYTFRNNDLVKRCLYLFAGVPMDRGVMASCMFIEPRPIACDLALYDYSLFFISVLYDYYRETGDAGTLIELWPTALNQIRFGLGRLDERGIVRDDPSWYAFIDWHPDLNKQGGAQAVLIYAMKQARELARELSQTEAEASLACHIERVTEAALKHLWDAEKGFFISGAKRQVSWATQVWMVLAGVFGQRGNAELLDRLYREPPAIRLMTPYSYHHLVEALFLNGRSEKALEELRSYWGGMLKAGADTYFEVYNLQDDFLSPYGDYLINSYCHAWSSTPTYFIRKYLV